MAEVNIKDVAEKIGQLRSVCTHQFLFNEEPPLVGAIQFKFENGVLFHEVEPNFDEILLTS